MIPSLLQLLRLLEIAELVVRDEQVAAAIRICVLLETARVPQRSLLRQQKQRMRHPSNNNNRKKTEISGPENGFNLPTFFLILLFIDSCVRYGVA